jgi:hypothetical protein
VRVAARWVNNHIRRFVQDDKLGVFVYDVKRNVFGQNVFAWALRKDNVDYVTWAEFEALLNDLTVNLDVAAFDCILDEMAAEVAEPAVKVFVEPALFDRVPHVKRQRLASGIWRPVHLTS